MRFIRARGLRQVESVPCALGCGRPGVIVVVGTNGRRVCGHCGLDMPSEMLMVPRGRR